MVKIFTAHSHLNFDLLDNRTKCALGKGGVTPADKKREGDGATPGGIWPIRYIFYRPDRLDAPVTALKTFALQPDDLWCDDYKHHLYNCHVKAPFSGRHEKLWREDSVYDIIGVLGHNDDPVVPMLGSAIFLHLAKDDFSPTEGCIALSLSDMLLLLKSCGPEAAIKVAI